MSKTVRSFNLENEILKPIAKRIKSKKDSLKELRRFAKNMGFEGWLKVETIATLGRKIAEVRNRGADLLLDNGIEIELKCATNFDLSWIKNGALKYQTPCLFLGDGGDREKINKLESDNDTKMIGYEVFDDGKNEWIIGMIEPLTAKDEKGIKDVKQIKSTRPSGNAS